MNNPNDPLAKARQFLGGGSDQGWIFGVCTNIARRTGWELWIVRLVAVVALLTLTIASAVVYVALGMLMDETRPRTQRRLRTWAGQADRFVDAVWQGGKRFYDSRNATSAVDDNNHMARN